MATRSPTQHHSFWGPFANFAALPVVTDPRLQAGDTAYAEAEATLYTFNATLSAWQAVGGITELTTDVVAGPGSGTQTATVAGIQTVPVDATAPTAGQVLAYSGIWWTPTTLPAATVDHFAPRWIVGNQLAGDPTTAQAAPFRYICDPGDGTGIALALSEATTAGRGDILVRSGVYTLPSGTATFQIPSNVTLRGSGWETEIVSADDQRAVFKVNEMATLADLKITMSQPTLSPTGTLAVELAGSVNGNATASNLYVDASLGQNIGTFDSLIGCIGSLADPQAGSIGARVLDCTAIGNYYTAGQPAPNQFFCCFSFPDADQAVIRGVGLFGDYLLDLTGSSSRCTVTLNGENFRTAKISGYWHQLQITSVTFFNQFDALANPEAVQFIGAQRCAGSLVITGSDVLGPTTGMVMDETCVGNRITLTCEGFGTGATISGSKNVLSGISVDAGIGQTATGIDFTASSSSNVLIGGVLDATTPVVDSGSLNEIAHTV